MSFFPNFLPVMPEPIIHIALLEDHRLQLEGLSALLSQRNGLKITGSFSTPEEFLAKKNDITVDVLVADLHMPGLSGIEVAELLKKENYHAKVILLTMQRGARFLQKAEKAGAKGYALKNISVDELEKMIRRVYNGESIYDESLRTYTQEDDIHIKSTITVDEKPEELLSEREKEILVMVCKEYSSAQIAEKLFISTGTVDTHRKNILVKLGVNNTVGLVKYALKHNLLNN